MHNRQKPHYLDISRNVTFTLKFNVWAARLVCCVCIPQKCIHLCLSVNQATDSRLKKKKSPIIHSYPKVPIISIQAQTIIQVTAVSLLHPLEGKMQNIDRNTTCGKGNFYCASCIAANLSSSNSLYRGSVMGAGPCERSVNLSEPTRWSMMAGRRVSNGRGSVMTPGPAIENAQHCGWHVPHWSENIIVLLSAADIWKTDSLTREQLAALYHNA